MKISWKWLSELVDLKTAETPSKLAEILTQRGLEVEEVHTLAQGFERVVTAQILERNPHPQADRLSLCKVLIGAASGPGSKDAPLEIVCGAQNMKAGDKVALAQIGARLPNGLVIAKSKIRGVESNGMLCSEEELKLKDKAEGILILPPGTPLGKPLAEFLALDDTILTFKLTANRGDCLSHYGMAREIASALGVSPKRPSFESLAFTGSPIAVALEAGESAPQFLGCAIDGVKVGPSPTWVKSRLEALGQRSINNVVDATNLVLLETGHPVHAYDADRIEGKKITVRMAQAGEKIPLLDGTEITLAGTELIIADGTRAVGLAGVMGGENSEVTDATVRVFLECAEFAPALVRRAAARHAKKTEASHRFERGIDPDGLPHVIGRLAKLVIELAGGKVTGSTRVQLPHAAKPARSTIEFVPGFVTQLLGVEVGDAEIEKILRGLECGVQKNAKAWTVSPPSYRRDLVIREDLVEEVARSIGYDRIPETIPVVTSPPLARAEAEASAGLELLMRAKRALAGQGLCENIQLAFTSQAWLKEFNLEGTVRVVNPLSEELEVMIPSLLPGLVRAAVENTRKHFGSDSLAIRLFELRPTFSTTAAVAASGEMATNVMESWKLGVALSGPRYAQALKNEQGEVDFYDLKAAVESLCEEMGARGVRFVDAGNHPRAGLFHPGQSVEILAGNQSAGVMGLLHPGHARSLKLRAPLWLAEIDWKALVSLSRKASNARRFKSWTEFPPMERDFALLVKDGITADKITQTALKSGKPLAKVARIFDVYRGSQVTEGMTSVAVRVIFFDEGRSLQEAETEAASAKILEAWKKDLGAELRS